MKKAKEIDYVFLGNLFSPTRFLWQFNRQHSLPNLAKNICPCNKATMSSCISPPYNNKLILIYWAVLGLLGISLGFLATLPPVLDCTQWMTENRIVPYDASHSVVAHTLITEDGNMHVNPASTPQDACIRALHAQLSASHTKRNRMLSSESNLHG